MFIDPDDAEVVAAGLVGGADVAGGPTPEQWQVIEAIASSLLARPDLDAASLEPLGPDAVAAALVGDSARRRFHELLVAVEACRHPLDDAQVARVEAYATALGIEGPDLALLRTLVDAGVTRAAADFARFLDDNLSHRFEPQLTVLGVVTDRPEEELAAELLALSECAPGTLGRALFEFYERGRFPVPGEEASAINHFYVSHDFTHVIAGIEPTAAGEIALSAFQMAMNDNPTNTSALLASLIVHEVGVGHAGKLEAESGVLADPGAAKLFGEELARGAACTGDFSLIDHLGRVDEQLADIRAEFGVRPPANTNDGHHHW